MFGTQRFSFKPNPPQRGDSLEVEYDFTGLAETSTTITIRFTPGDETTFEVTVDEPSVSVSVPCDAVTVTASDKSGNSPDHTAPCAGEVCGETGT